MRKLVIPAMLLLVSTLALAQQTVIDWINSPEAYFVTAAERAEWFRLTTDGQREAFQKRYWLMRDPTPATEPNEFQVVILDRIKKADAKFSIAGGLKGSRTGQGMVYIVFGPPARIQNNFEPPLPRPRPPDQPPPVGVGVVEGNETTAVWTYDHDRTPRVLDALSRPNLQITILIEPSRRRDTIQAPGVVDHYREMLAERSISNPSANVAIAPPTLGIASARIDANIPESIRTLLRDAKPGTQSADVTFTAGDIWGANQSGAVVAFSLASPDDRTAHLTTYGVVRSGDRVVASVAEPFTTTDVVSTAAGHRATAMHLDLPPGSYQGSFALVDDRTNTPLAVVAAPIRVGDPMAAFDVSSLVVSGEPVHGGATPFSYGDLVIRPRADLLFIQNESLWYFASVRSTTGTGAIIAEVQLRHEGKTVAARSFTPRLGEIAPGVFLIGEELPLTPFAPGDYSLYLIVHGANGLTEVRRADFRVRI